MQAARDRLCDLGARRTCNCGIQVHIAVVAKSPVRLLDVAVSQSGQGRWKWNVSDGTTEIAAGFETTREAAQTRVILPCSRCCPSTGNKTAEFGKQQSPARELLPPVNGRRGGAVVFLPALIARSRAQRFRPDLDGAPASGSRGARLGRRRSKPRPFIGDNLLSSSGAPRRGHRLLESTDGGRVLKLAIPTGEA